MAGADEKSSTDSVRMITEAEGGWRVRRKEPASGSTICTRARLDALHGLDGARDLAFQRPHAA